MAAEGSHIYPCAEPRQLCAGVARRRHKQGREEKGPHGQDKSQSRVCHRSRASAWAQPWGVTPSESRAPARLLALARRNAIRRARRAGRRGAGPSEIAQHRISMCPSCLPVPARASSRLAHSPSSRAINAGPTLGQRAPHATPFGTSRDRRYGRESYPNLFSLLQYTRGTRVDGRLRSRSTVDFFQIARAHNSMSHVVNTSFSHPRERVKDRKITHVSHTCGGAPNKGRNNKSP